MLILGVKMHIGIFLKISLLEYNCITMLCQFQLYNKVNQLYVCIYPHIPSFSCLPPTLPIPPLSRWSQSTELMSPRDAASSHQLSILHLVVYICQSYSPASSQLTLPHPRVLKSILYICIVILVLRLGSSEFFFWFHTYVLVYSICFSLSDLLHSV